MAADGAYSSPTITGGGTEGYAEGSVHQRRGQSSAEGVADREPGRQGGGKDAA